jgi:hypothetical protein
MEEKQPFTDNERSRYLDKAREIGRAKEDPAADELERQLLQKSPPTRLEKMET